MRSLWILVVVVSVLLLPSCAPEAPPPDHRLRSSADTSVERLALHSRPDLDPPIVTMSGPGLNGAEEGYFFLAPKDDWSDDDSLWAGGLIVDADGEPVYIDPEGKRKYDYRVQTLDGEQVLTWWEGDIDPPVAHGEVVIMDDSYTEIGRVSVGGDLEPGTTDVHETTITDDDTMLLIAYDPVRTDLSGIDGPTDGWVFEDVVQEIDIATGEVLFEWRSLDDIPVTAAKTGIAEDEATREKPFDYLHLNSVTVDDDGSLLLSARTTHAVYNLDRDTGRIRWVLGGTDSDFDVADDAVFGAQHDAHRQPDGTITMFDNRASAEDGDSRGLRLDVDMDAMTATVAQEYLPPEERWSISQGNLQELPGGDVVVGWGSEPYFTRYSHDAQLLLEGTYPAESHYRAYWFDWTATPTEPPAAVLTTDGASSTVHASWNGATEVVGWQVLSGTDASDARVVATANRTGFETAIEVPDPGDHLEVEALDADGEVLGSAVVGQ